MIFADPEFWRRLDEEITKKRAHIVEGFELGRVKKEDYDREVGFLTGLRWVADIADDIMKELQPHKREK